jgi:hypothetical protein
MGFYEGLGGEEIRKIPSKGFFGWLPDLDSNQD